jgi:ATP/ADP translocase
MARRGCARASRRGRSPYLRAIAAVVCLSSFMTAIAAWQFKAMAHAGDPRPDRLAAFFGSFNFYAGLLSLAVQWLVTTRLLQRAGVGWPSSSCRRR